MPFPRPFSRPVATPPRPPTGRPETPTFDLPPSVQAWPAPGGVKRRPAHWMRPERAYRAFLEAVLRAQGEDALALIWHDGPRTPRSPLTRWCCPGVPIHTSGHQAQQGARPLHGYYLPARAALQAAECGLVHFAGEGP